MIHVGSCLDILPTLAADHFDSIVTDPPYELGFMGKAWDRSGVAFQPETWAAALRVAKPGAYLAAFGGTRTFHRMMVAIEDAGWEIRDTLMWVYGSGFPKSRNGEWGGTALKPAWEPIVMARKPFKCTVGQNFAKHGTGGLNIDGCRVGDEERTYDITMVSGGFETTGGGRNRKQGEATVVGRWPANLVHDGSEEVLAAFPNASGQKADIADSAPSARLRTVYEGGELHRNRLGEPSAESENAGAVGFKMRPGARRIDTGSAARFFYCAKASREDRNEGCDGLPLRTSGMVSNTSGQHMTRRDGGAPAPAANNHPTVKPTDLMRWLCRLVTPSGGHVLDPFTGSGSTGRGAILEGFEFTGIELSEDYARIAEARIRVAQPGLAL